MSNTTNTNERPEELMISVPLNTYSALLGESEKLRVFCKAILTTADLNYKKTGLEFDDTTVEALLMATYPEAVLDRIFDLQQQKEEK